MQRIPYKNGSQGRLQGIAQNLVGRSSARKFEKMSSWSFYSGARVQPARTARIVTYLEAIEAAGTDEGVENIVVLPPDNGDNRDADSDVEDILAEGGDNDGCDVGHEAAGEFELDNDRDESASSEDDDLVDVGPGAKRLRTARASACSISRRWRKMSSFDTVLPTGRLDEVLASHHPDLLSKSHFELWGEIFPTGLTDMIVEQTNLYATRERNDASFSTSRSEMLQFLGVLLLSRYHRLPHEDHYWSNDEDMGVDIVSSAPSRNAFRSIECSLHFADNQQLPVGDKVAKVSPLYSILNTTLTKFGVFHPDLTDLTDLSIDESMVPYFGKHSCKMFIRGNQFASDIRSGAFAVQMATRME